MFIRAVCALAYLVLARGSGDAIDGSRLLAAGSLVSDRAALCDLYSTMPASTNRAKLTNWCGQGDASSVCGAAGTSRQTRRTWA